MKPLVDLRAHVVSLTGGETIDTDRFVLWLERTDPELKLQYQYVPYQLGSPAASLRAGELHVANPEPAAIESVEPIDG